MTAREGCGSLGLATSKPALRKTGYVWHEAFTWHVGGVGFYEHSSKIIQFFQPIAHVETPESKRRIHSLLEVSDLLRQLVRITPVPATIQDVERFHTHDYVERLKAQSDNGGGDGGDCAPFNTGAFGIALLAAGGLNSAIEAVWKGEIANAYCLVRPPGHHAERDRGRGFCLVNNIAIAAMHAMEVLGVKRIVIIDWDVHHGNGTQQAFWESNNVMFISIHQDRNYPYDSGLATELGSGAGLGYNWNIPLPPGCGDGAYMEAMSAACKVAAHAFGSEQAELVLVSCGFDPAFTDPLGSMMCHSGTFRAMTKMVRELAESSCNGKLVLTHEGGYSESYAPFCGLAVVEELSGATSAVKDSLEDEYKGLGQQELQPHQKAAIDAALAHLLDVRPDLAAALSA
mmetsp:Transcript_20132/g.48026  ORF Transcript_20132/g.48026 Transcript_20132/m.48026 type:complete len:400 (-) Transcript_20132:203-1402(-)